MVALEHAVCKPIERLVVTITAWVGWKDEQKIGTKAGAVKRMTGSGIHPGMVDCGPDQGRSDFATRRRSRPSQKA